MLWLLFLSQSVFAMSSVAVDIKCVDAPKSFKISEEKSQFQEISIIKGQQIRIKSRAPNEDIMIDCRELMTPAKAEAQNWNGLKQEVKLGFWDFIIPPMLIAKLKSDVTLTNKNEFPIFSKIFVEQTRKRTSIMLTQSPWKKGDGIRVSCPSTERASRKETIQVAVFKAGDIKGLYTLVDNDLGKPILPDGPEKVVCNEERYSLSLSEGTLQKATADQGTPSSTTPGEIVK